MTRRDFELIAEVLANEVAASGYSDTSKGALRRVATGFADRLRAVNPRFDRARFMAACGFKGE